MDKLKAFLGTRKGKALLVMTLVFAGQVAEALGVPGGGTAARFLAGLVGVAG